MQNEINQVNRLLPANNINECSTYTTILARQNYFSHSSNLTNTYFIYLKHEVNQEKGAVTYTGIAQATGDYLLVQDADMENNPSEYKMLLKPFVLDSADVVYGSRFMIGNPHRIQFFWQSINHVN